MARRSLALLLVVQTACTGSEAEPPPIASHVAALVNGSPCMTPSDCDSGICEDGLCCAVACGTCYSCNATGTTCAVVPADDAACGTIDCDGLDLACRDFSDLTANRCEGIGDCKDANAAADCTTFTDVGAGMPCGTGGTGFQDGFESGTSAWILQSPWGTTSTTAQSGTYSLTDSPAGNYSNSRNVAAQIATPVSLVGVTSPTLTFHHRYQVESGFDNCRVEVSTNGGTSWIQIASYTGSLTAWTAVTLSLTAYAGQPSFLVRFRLQTDGSVTGDGWYLDNVTINSGSAVLCRACDGAGACTVPLADDARCGTIDCDGLDSLCGNFTDLTTDRCETDGCKDPNTSDCTIFTATPVGTDCGVCGACDGLGLCAADLAQDADCSACRVCGGVGSCVSEPAGTDEKNDCAPGPCASGDCSGSGSCQVSPLGTDCGQCAECNSSGTCVVDLSQDADCPLCQECTGLSTCGVQAFGADAKNECASGLCLTGGCDGLGACDQLSDGTSCDVGLCSTGATCTDGMCGPPDTMVTCNPPGACMQAGSCDPSTGLCGASPGPIADGSFCDDGRPCTIGDRCLGGTCSPTVNNCRCESDADCVPLDGCHGAGSCDTVSGACSYPELPDGTSCSDGTACTTGDSCQGGTCTPAGTVACTALDTCHLPGTCNPATGLCSNPRKPPGSACDDGRECTTGDACEAGVCTPSATTCPCSSDSDCFALGQCHQVGTCDLGTMLCSTPTVADGTVCDDADVCTTGETCQAGACGSPATTTECTASDACHLPGTCDPESGDCDNPSAPDGTACPGGACQVGICLPPVADAGPRADAPASGGSDGGCGCRAAGRHAGGTAWAWLLLVLLATPRARPRRRRDPRRG